MNRVMLRHFAWGIFCLTFSCSGRSTDPNRGEQGGSGGSTNPSTGDGDSDEMMGSAPAPGTSQEGWEKAYADQGGACDREEDGFANLPHLTFGSTTLYVGFEQVSSQNQDPIFARFDEGQMVYCRYHETQGPDGRALGLTWDGGEHAYVVYTIVGGGSDLEGKGGWLGSYAPGALSGGGPKVSYVGRVNVEDGNLETGSFIVAVLSSNKVNTHNPTGAVTVLEDGSVEFLGESAHKPIDSDGKSWMDCTDYPFSTRYRLSADLTTLICADSTNCVSQTPCDD